MKNLQKEEGGDAKHVYFFIRPKILLKKCLIIQL